MVFLDLILNLSLLVALSILSGFIENRWPRHTRLSVLLQGALFGGTAVLGMLRPLTLEPGLIFDGRSVMVSLWKLDDRATSELMAAFYKNLKTMSRSEALQQAQLVMMKKYENPYYWGAFVLYGDYR